MGRAARRLPLLLLAAMLLIGIVVEALRFGDVAWWPKLPLAALLAAALAWRAPAERA